MVKAPVGELRLIVFAGIDWLDSNLDNVAMIKYSQKVSAPLICATFSE
jgi:hypothetical protein